MTGRRLLHRLPAAPLVAAARRRCPTKTGSSPGSRPDPDGKRPDRPFGLLELLGSGHYTVYQRARRDGTIPWTMADQLAIKFGYHPYEIWGDDWLFPDPFDEPAADPQPAGGPIGSDDPGIVAA